MFYFHSDLTPWCIPVALIIYDDWFGCSLWSLIVFTEGSPFNPHVPPKNSKESWFEGIILVHTKWTSENNTFYHKGWFVRIVDHDSNIALAVISKCYTFDSLLIVMLLFTLLIECLLLNTVHLNSNSGKPSVPSGEWFPRELVSFHRGWQEQCNHCSILPKLCANRGWWR